MMIVMKATATEAEVQAVISRIEEVGARAHPSRGEEVILIGAIGDHEHVQRLAERGVLVRAGGALGRPGALRVTVGTDADNERFLTALGTLLG